MVSDTKTGSEQYPHPVGLVGRRTMSMTGNFIFKRGSCARQRDRTSVGGIYFGPFTRLDALIGGALD